MIPKKPIHLVPEMFMTGIKLFVLTEEYYTAHILE
jgi:hypothetical protein